MRRRKRHRDIRREVQKQRKKIAEGELGRQRETEKYTVAERHKKTLSKV